jgi:hypothetical protein
MAAAFQDQAEQAPDEQPRPKAKIPWRKRFHAWWEGYELIVQETFGEDDEPEAVSDDTAQEAPSEIEPLLTEPWPRERVAMIQRIWSEGFNSPGGGFHILDLVKPLDLSASRHLLHFGAGLGGPARLLDETFDVHVKGWEPNPELAAAGGPEVQLYDPETVASQDDDFDFVFSKEALFKMADKDGLFEVLKGKLAERGQMILTDYVLAEEGGDDQAVQAWLGAEPVARFPETEADHLARLEKFGLEVRSNEDITDTHSQLVLRGWEYFLESLAEEKPEPAQRALLRNELEVWARRMQLMEAGKIKVCCIHARRT